MSLEDLMGPEEDQAHFRRMTGIGADKFGNPDLTVTRAADKTVLAGAQTPNREPLYIATAKMDPPTLLMKQNNLPQHVWYQSQQQPAAWLSYLNFNLQREIQFEATGNYYSKPYPSSITMAFEKVKPETIAYLRKIGAMQPEYVPPTPTKTYKTRTYNSKTRNWTEATTTNSAQASMTVSAVENSMKKGGDYTYAELYVDDKLITTVGTKPMAPPPAPTPQPVPAKKSGCFIATASYGTPLAPEIDVLRQFRDDRLLADPLGRAFVKGYYTVSPPIARAVSLSETLKWAVRGLIAPLVRGR